MNTLLKRFLFTFSFFVFLLMSVRLYSQTTPTWNAELTPNGANSLVFRYTKQVWLNPTIILARKEFEASTHVKLLLLPRINNNDTSSNIKLENAFDKVFALLYSDETTGSIKFYFNSQNTSKPFTFATSEELWCKFTPAQKDTVEQLLNKVVARNNDMSDFSKLPFESVINQASRYCKQVLLSSTKTCGANPKQVFSSININSVPAKLNFEQAPFSTQPTGDVDEQQYDALKAYYNSATDSVDDSNYPIAWKAMSSSNDVIKLKLKKNSANFNLAEVKFKNSGGTETYTTQISPDDNTLLKINISGKPAGTMAEVVAYYTAPSNANLAATTYPIGAFNVQFYQTKPPLKLVLVNLGAAQMPDINKVQEELTKIYGSIFIKWDVSTINYNLPSELNKSLTIENSGLLSNYPASMQPIIKDFKSKNNVDANTYYLFFGCSNNNSLLGYMPRARNIGFIFDSSPHTIAHELGHGAFNLKHIFSSDELGEGNRGQTDNLMDYAPINGSNTKPEEALYKYQWDLIHNPSFVGWFEGDDEDGEMKIAKAKPVAIISDTILTEGMVFVYNGSGKQMKVKFETSDTSKTKIAYQLIILIKSSNTTLNYPKTGYDTLIYNQIKEITLDSIPKGKYTLVCKLGKTEYKTNFNIRKNKLEITKEQLKTVFTSTDTATLAKVAATINAYSGAFGIVTEDRMTQFLAQTGYESGGFKEPKGESGCYTSSNANGWSIWFNKTWAEPPFGTNCDISLNPCVKKSKKLKWTALKCDSTSKNCIVVPTEYVSATTNPIKGDALTKKFFSYVYQCEGGNENSASEDGYKYRGHGAIQLTWKKSYQAFDNWLKSNYKGKDKEIVSNPTVIDSDKELFILSAMWFWNTNNLNEKADNGNFDDITKAINRGNEGKSDRLKYLNNLKKEIK